MAKTLIASPADVQRLKRRRRGADLYQPIIDAFAPPGVYLERRNAATLVLQEGKTGKRGGVRAGALGTPDLTGWTMWRLRARNFERRLNSDAEGEIHYWNETTCRGHYVPSAITVAIEVKPPDWRPRSRREQVRHYMQQGYLDRVRREGGLAWVISGPEDVARVLAP